MRRLLLIALAVGLLVITALGAWLLATEAGLRYAVGRVDGLADTALSARQWRGRLLGPVYAEGLQLDIPAARVSAAKAMFDWQPLALLRGRLVIDPVEASDVRVTLQAPRDEAPANGRGRLPVLFTSVGLKGRVGGLSVTDATGVVVLAPSDVTLAAVLHHDLSLTLEQAVLDHPQGRFEATGRLGLEDEAALDLETVWRVQRPGMVPLQGQGSLRGVFARPEIDQQLLTPWQARLQGSLAWRDGPLRWEAHLALARGVLADLDPAWPELRLSGALQGSGTGRALALSTTLDLHEPSAGAWRAEAVVRHDVTAWMLPRLLLVRQDGAGRVEGEGQLRLGDDGLAELSLAWQDLGWPAAEPASRSPAGTLEVRGHPDAWTLAGEAVLEQAGHPPGRVDLEGLGDRHHLRLERLRADWLGGRVQGGGQVHWSPALRFEGELALSRLNPGHLAPQWPGKVDAKLALGGTWSEATGREVRVDMRSLGGELRGHALGGKASLSYMPGKLNIRELVLTSGTARFTASGSLAQSLDLQLALQAKDLDHVLPELHGALTADARLRGNVEAPQLQAGAEGSGLQWQGRQVADLMLNAELDVSGRVPSHLALSADGVEVSGLRAAAVTLSGTGTPAAHTVTLAMQLAPGEVDMALAGSYGGGTWQGVLRDGRWRGDAGVWTQQAPAPLRVSAEGAQLDQACFAQVPARLCLAGSAGHAGITAQAQVERVPMALFKPLLPRRDLAVSGELNGGFDLRYGDGLRRLRADLHAAAGELRLDLPGDEAFTTTYHRLSLAAQGDEDGLHLRAAAEMKDGDFARAEARLPGWRPGMALSGDLMLDGRLQASMGQLMWVSLFVPEVIIPDGRLEADLQLRGTASRPVIDGSADLVGGTIAIPLLGIELGELRVFARGDPAGGMQLSATARSGPGSVQVSGTAGRSPQGWHADLRVHGQDFQAVRLPMGEALATPDLTLRAEDGVIRVGGRVLIPQARVNFEDVSAPAQVSSDVVVIDARDGEASARQRWQVVTELEVVFGEQVRIAGYGLEGRLGGAITILEPLRGVATARGEVNVLDGKYEAYGQSLTIAQGRLIYANAPLGNPGVDFRAVRREEDVTVGITATGRLRSPEVRLYSEPPMDDSQILAWLVLGRPIDDATREEADLLQRAAVSLGLAGGTSLAEDIAGEFGVDVVQVEASTQRQEAALVLGKYLSPRLYVQYAVGLFQAQDSVRVRYRLSEHWTLEAQSGTRSSADILYTIEK